MKEVSNVTIRCPVPLAPGACFKPLPSLETESVDDPSNNFHECLSFDDLRPQTCPTKINLREMLRVKKSRRETWSLSPHPHPHRQTVAPGNRTAEKNEFPIFFSSKFLDNFKMTIVKRSLTPSRPGMN